ncbi:MAG: DegQ family serine endoprotease [Burkholderiales bacterium]|nr:DegQ family serine endoprotease [Burkholderiales bacterium]
MQSHVFKRTAVAIAVAGAFGLGAIAADRHIAPGAAVAATTPAPAAATAAPTQRAALPDVADLVERESGAVVEVSMSRGLSKTSGSDERRGPQGRLPKGLPPELAPFFRGMPGGDDDGPGRGPSQGMGSGFIVDPNGIILTNAHVVDGADEVTVRLADRREFKAKVLGSDQATDVAVLKIDAKDLPTVRTGDARKTRVGEWVVAIGAPYGLEHSVTSGIVSAKSRSLPGDTVVPFIQTDAAVNPGNSGGPLFNMNGEVIGINSQIFSRSGGFQGLAFAVPINVALDVKDQIVTHGKVSHGKLGVTVQEVNQALAESFGMKQPGGALVGSVQKNGPADKAGLEPGDVILSFDGQAIGKSGDLPPLVASVKPGSTVKIEVWRDGKSRDLTATVGDRGDGKVPSTKRADAGEGKLGVVVRPLSKDEKEAAKLASGLVVADVGGAAEKAGVRPGDVIVSANRTPVSSPAELKGVVDKAGKAIALLIQRDDARIFVPVPLG